MRSRMRRGSALIEVLVALVLLAVAGVAMVTLLGQTSHTMRAARDTERETRIASQALDRIAAMDRASLVASIGRHDVTGRGGLRADVVETSLDLFDVSISTTDTSVALLRTVFYRPPTNPDP